MKLAVVGATGLVGSEVLKVLKDRSFQYDEIMLVASSRSVGKTIDYNGRQYEVISMEEAVKRQPDVAIFFCWRRHLPRMGAKICRSGHHRYR